MGQLQQQLGNRWPHSDAAGRLVPTWELEMRRHGCMRAPRVAVTTHAVLKLMRLGSRFTSAFTGATTLAAMLVLMVASRKPALQQEVAQHSCWTDQQVTYCAGPSGPPFHRVC